MIRLYSLALALENLRGNIERVLIFAYSVCPDTIDALFGEDTQNMYVIYQTLSYPTAVQTSKERKQYRDNIEADERYIRFPSRSANRRHMNGKGFILQLNDQRIFYTQLTMELDRYLDPAAKQLMYVGNPKHIDRLFSALEDILRICDQEDHDVMTDWIPTFEDLFARRVQDEDTFMIVQTPEWRTQANGNALQHTRDALNNAYGNGQYAYSGKQGPSSLLMHFPFVSLRAYQALCQGIVRDFSRNIQEALHTHVRFTTPKAVRQDGWSRENWIARYYVHNENENQLVWFALTTFNLTEPSYGPDARNFEFTVMTFSPPNGIKAFLEDKINNPHLDTILMSCSRPNEEDEEADFLPPIPTKFCGFRTGRNRKYHECEPTLSTPFIWNRAKKALERFILPFCTGSDDLLYNSLMKTFPAIRFALYNMLFCELGRGYKHTDPLRKHVPSVRHHFIRQLNAIQPDTLRPIWYNCPHRDVILDALVDVFVRWSAVFYLFQPLILKSPPVVDLMSLVQGPVRDILQYPSDIVANCPYVSVSLLIQNLFNDMHVWFTCPLGHSYFWSVRRSMTLINPSCMVCKVSDDVRMCYNVLREYTDYVTVEFPIHFLLQRKDVTEADASYAPSTRASSRKQQSAAEEGAAEVPKKRGTRREIKKIRTAALGYLNAFRKKRNQNQDDQDDEEIDDDDQDDDYEYTEEEQEKQGQVKGGLGIGEMRFDVFAIYENQFVAIEFDDQSHYVGQRSENKISLLNAQRDARKNMWCQVMGIHLLRLRSLDNRPNAMAKVRRAVKLFMDEIGGHRVDIFPNTFSSVLTEMGDRFHDFRDMTLNIETIKNMEAIATPNGKVHKLPVYMALVVDERPEDTLPEDVDTRMSAAANQRRHTFNHDIPIARLLNINTVFIFASHVCAFREDGNKFRSVKNNSWKGHFLSDDFYKASYTQTGRMMITETFPNADGTLTLYVLPLDSRYPLPLEWKDIRPETLCRHIRKADCSQVCLRDPTKGDIDRVRLNPPALCAGVQGNTVLRGPSTGAAYIALTDLMKNDFHEDTMVTTRENPTRRGHPVHVWVTGANRDNQVGVRWEDENEIQYVETPKLLYYETRQPIFEGAHRPAGRT